MVYILHMCINFLKLVYILHMYIIFLRFDIHFTHVYQLFEFWYTFYICIPFFKIWYTFYICILIFGIWYTFHICISIFQILIYILHMYTNLLQFNIHFACVYQFSKLKWKWVRQISYSYLGYFSYDIEFSCSKGNYLTNERIVSGIGKWSNI